jgi:hypothetical protein
MAFYMKKINILSFATFIILILVASNAFKLIMGFLKPAMLIEVIVTVLISFITIVLLALFLTAKKL